MISRWSIRRKLGLGVVLVAIAVTALSVTGYQGVAAFRALAKSVRLRAPELPLSSELAQDVSKLLVTYDLYQKSANEPVPWLFDNEPMSMEAVFGIDDILNGEFEFQLNMVETSFHRYGELLAENRASDEYRKLSVNEEEQAAVEEFKTLLASIRRESKDGLEELVKHADHGNVIASSAISTDNDSESTKSDFEIRLERLDALSKELPQHLHESMRNFADDVRGKYRMLIFTTALFGLFAVSVVLMSLRLFYAWIFQPLQVLVKGSRRVADGEFEHRIQLSSDDEMAELAKAMNNMTQKFCDIRDDLNQKVQERTKEVVRSEQLASVGFLAAGVAHEINNPLASIAMCAESLEERLGGDEADEDDDASVVREYLRMIQTEAFRCKEITERLLDFSRLGDVEKQQTNLAQLVAQVMGTIKHLGKYKEKEVAFEDTSPVFAAVNEQEIKQVVLNLLTNALDSLDPGGKVQVTLKQHADTAQLVVKDNGCGMSAEVQKNLFEPFYTRRRDGQGTGLGMSITYRIVNDHGGSIEPFSAGPGKGSTIIVSLPLTNHDEKQSQIRQAA